MFTNFYCIVQSSPWISHDSIATRADWHTDRLARTSELIDGYDGVNRSAQFDLLSRGGAKKGILVDRSAGNAYWFRPMVGDLIRPSASQTRADGADLEVDIYRWTGDEATATKFKPLAAATLSYSYPLRGEAQGLSFWMDDDLLLLKKAYPQPAQQAPIKNPKGEQTSEKPKTRRRREAKSLREEARRLEEEADLDALLGSDWSPTLW